MVLYRILCCAMAMVMGMRSCLNTNHTHARGYGVSNFRGMRHETLNEALRDSILRNGTEKNECNAPVVGTVMVYVGWFDHSGCLGTYLSNGFYQLARRPLGRMEDHPYLRNSTF